MKAIKSDMDGEYYKPKDLEFIDGILGPKSGATPVNQQANCGCVHHAEDGYPCPHDLELAGLEGVEDEQNIDP